MRSRSAQETVSNESVEILVGMQVRTNIKIDSGQPDVLAHDNEGCSIALTEVGAASQAGLVKQGIRANTAARQG